MQSTEMQLDYQRKYEFADGQRWPQQGATKSSTLFQSTFDTTHGSSDVCTCAACSPIYSQNEEKLDCEKNMWLNFVRFMGEGKGMKWCKCHAGSLNVEYSHLFVEAGTTSARYNSQPSFHPYWRYMTICPAPTADLLCHLLEWSRQLLRSKSATPCTVSTVSLRDSRARISWTISHRPHIWHVPTMHRQNN